MIESHTKTILEALGRNPVHPFPARMSPGIALEALDHGTKLQVLDPMMGSGTVLAVARALGHRAIGVDMDPLAVLLSKVWVTSIDPDIVKKKAIEVLQRARRAFDQLASGEAYPADADNETKEFLRYWFDDYSRRQLWALACSIRRVHDGEVRDVLWCAFSRLIITKQAGASLAMDLSHSRPHKSFTRAPSKPFTKFLQAVDKVAENCPHRGMDIVGPLASTILGDARKLPIPAGSIHLVLTSPPYLNAIDYMRCSKFSLVWMGYSLALLRQIRSRSIGTEVSLPKQEMKEIAEAVGAKLKMRPVLSPRDAAIFARYVKDMHQAVAEVGRVLMPGGRAVYVVGNSSVHGTFVRNSLVLESVAEYHGLKLIDRRVRFLPPNRRYLPPPSAQRAGATLSTRMRQEVVLAFERPAAS